MTLDLVNYQDKATKAVRDFWKNRNRSGVTAGKNMDGFCNVVEAIVKANGLTDADIHFNRRLLTLPGYFRPTKQWDMLVLHKGILVAALEFKSQVGPSFGNNFNNRAEEAIGTAHDFWISYREQAFGKEAPKPFVGWFMLLEDAPASRSPVKDTSPHFDLFPDFKNASYAERYNILCHKLVQEQLYTSAAIILSPSSSIKTGNYSELADLTGLKTFVTLLAGHVASEAARVSG